MNKENSNKQPVVLIADDKMGLRMLACEALEQAGFDVEETDNGKAALAAFQRLQPNLVLLDVMMPWMDGYEESDKKSVIRTVNESEIVRFLEKPMSGKLLRNVNEVS